MVFPICVYRTLGATCTYMYMYMYVYICPYSNPEDLSLRHRLWLTSPSNQHTSVLLHHVHVYVYMTHREVRVVGVIGVIYRFLGFSLDVTVLLLLILQVYRHDHHMNNSTHMYITSTALEIQYYFSITAATGELCIVYTFTCTRLKSMNHNSLGCEQPYITQA